MTTGYLLLWGAFLAYVGFRATLLFRKKRFGLAIAMTFLALFVTYEVAMQWYEARSQPSPPSQTAPSPALPAQGPSTPTLAPPPQAHPPQVPASP